jgi:pilus assembly protein CpaB
MKTRAFWMLGLALVMAALAVFLAQGWLGGQGGPANAGVPSTMILVAKTPLEFGMKIKAENLRRVEWPKHAVPEGSFATADELIKPGEERIALRRIDANEPILRGKVSGFGGKAGMSAMIADGMRASAVRVNDVNGVAGFVLPGDRVDVLITRTSTGGKRGGDMVTNTLLQHVKVLAVDQDINQAKDKPQVAKSVTLEVTPEQTQMLVLAQQVGTLSLALRNANSANAEAPRSVSLRDLGSAKADDNEAEADGGGQGMVTESPSPAPGGPSVNVYRGVKPESYEVTTEAAEIRGGKKK